MDIVTTPPSALIRDLALKLAADLDGVLKRNFDIMQLAVTPQETVSLILSGLALRGIKSGFEMAADTTLFLHYVEIATSVIKNDPRTNTLTATLDN